MPVGFTNGNVLRSLHKYTMSTILDLVETETESLGLNMVLSLNGEKFLVNPLV